MTGMMSKSPTKAGGFVGLLGSGGI